MKKLLMLVLAQTCMVMASAQDNATVVNGTLQMTERPISLPKTRSVAKANTDEDTYRSIGRGMYQDPFHTLKYTSTGEIFIPQPWEIEIEESIEHPRKYRIHPYNSEDARRYFQNSDFNDYYVPIIIHAENPERIYLEPFATYDRTYLCLVPECGVNTDDADFYGKLNNNTITINRENMGRLSDNTLFYVNEDDRNFELTFPEGYIPVETRSGIYFGITAFNYAPSIKGIDLLTKENKADFKEFVNNMEKGNATYLYYSTEVAINTLKSSNFPQDLSSVAMITFTDGCDDGSLEMADKSWTDTDYQNHLVELLLNSRVMGYPIDAYSIGLRGNDVGDYNYAIFSKNLNILASNPQQATEVNNMSEVQNTLNTILDDLERSWVNHKVTCRINTRATGDIIRFTLDKSRQDLNNNPDNSELWIEGTFSRIDDSLNDVVYHGMASSSGTHVTAVKVTTDKGVKYSFTFENLVDDNGNPIEIGEIAYWHKRADDTIWNPHTEFTQGADAAIETEHKSAAIMFVMDCSDSLGDDYLELQHIVNSLIDRLMPEHNSSITSPHATDMPDSTYPVEYYNLQGMFITDPGKGLYIRRQGNTVEKVLLR